MSYEHSFRLSRRTLLAAAGTATVAAAAGCSSSSGTQGSAGKGANDNKGIDWPAHVDAPEVPDAYVSTVEGVSPAYTRLPDQITKSLKSPPGNDPSMKITSLQITWAKPAAPYDNNPFWQEMNKKLGVDYRPTFVPSDAWKAKFATTLAGGSVPDILMMTMGADSNRAMKDGAVADLSKIIGGDKIKDYPNLSNIPTYEWKDSAIYGGLFGFPMDSNYIIPEFKYRADWAKKVGLSAPTSPEEVIALGKAVSTPNAIEQGKTKYLMGAWTGNNIHWIYSMYRVPNGWRLEKDGSLINTIESDEYETAMEFMAKFWKAGGMHPDGFAMTAQGAKVRGLFASGDIGFTDGSFGYWAGPQGFTKQTMQAQPQAKLDFILPPGANGDKPGFPASTSFYLRVGISAKAAQDEKKLKVLLGMLDFFRAPFGSEEFMFMHYGPEGKGYKVENHLPVRIGDDQLETNVAGLNYNGMSPSILFDPSNPQASVQATKEYHEPLAKTCIKNPCAYVDSPTSDKLSASLSQLGNTYFTDIVSGKKPISALKDYRAAWKKAGGDKIRQEYQDALSAS